MEFTSGRRDGLYIIGEEKQKDAFTHPSIFALSSSSSSPSTSTAFRWHVRPCDGGAAGDGRRESDFFTEKEHMFDKVVTPSDVGKLNRLVIPKQHAERYFPLDPAAQEKGLLLSFEDRTGKSWRFRYSYWNSSQSYVMTKGWSRFVKEKRLDAGDIVSFGRGVGESTRDQLYIDWKPRPVNRDIPMLPLNPLTGVSLARPLGPWGGQFFIPPRAVHDHHRPGFGYNGMNWGSTGGGQLLFFRSSMARPPQIAAQRDSGSGPPMVLSSPPLVRNQAEAKRVRLFGVNLDCPESKGDEHLVPSARSPSAAQLQPASTLPFHPLPHGSMEFSEASSSTNKDLHLPLDLGL
ncbi:unnamed protein product [Musa hybrid cultivar]